VVLAKPQSPTATVKSWGEIVPMPFPESISNTEETVIRGVMVALTVMAGLRFIVKEGCDLYEELHKKIKRWRRVP
jgi:hypothetical protein